MKFLGAVWLIPRFSGIPESARAWHRQVGQIERRPRNFGEIRCRRSLLGGDARKSKEYRRCAEFWNPSASRAARRRACSKDRLLPRQRGGKLVVAAGATVEQRPCATPCALALRPRTGASSSCTRRPGAGGPWRRHRATRGRAGRTRRGRWRARCRPPPRPRPRPAAQPARCASRSSWTAGSWRPTPAASRSPPSRRPARGLGGADRRRLGRGRRRGRALPAPRLEARLVDPRPGPAGTTATTRREVATALRHYAGRLAAKGRAPGSIGLTGMESKGVL